MDLKVVEPIVGNMDRTGTPTATPMDPQSSLSPLSIFPYSGTMNRSFSTERYYKLTEDEHDQRLPLNAPTTVAAMEHNHCSLVDQELASRHGCPALISVRDFNQRFCAIVSRIYATILSEDKRRVHLDLLDECEPFADYLALAQEASRLNIREANGSERVAVFINLHNMMLVHITYKFGLPGTIWQRRKYLYSCYYNIGGHLFSLQSIFNGILRGNRKGLGMLWEPFGEQDYRNEFLIDGGEALVHFGLNNYTRSTPPIRTYSTEYIYEELRMNARETLCSKKFMQIDIKQGKILVAKLFKQYAEDFGQTPENLIKWLIHILGPPSDTRSQLLSRMLYTKNYTLAYLPMDTDLNMSYGVVQKVTNNVNEIISGNMENNTWTSAMHGHGEFVEGNCGGEENEIEE